MPLRMLLVLMFCSFFIIPCRLAVPKITEDIFEPGDDEDYQDDLDSLEKIAQEPLSIEEFETKSSCPPAATAKWNCQASSDLMKSAVTLKAKECAPYPTIVEVPADTGANGVYYSYSPKFVQLHRCIGSNHNTRMNVKCVPKNSKTLDIKVKHDSTSDIDCIVQMVNHTECKLT